MIPVYAVTGWAFSANSLEPLRCRLSASGDSLCSVSLFVPGTEAVEQLAAELPETPSHLIGWSLGGMLVLEFAAKYPQRVASLVLLSSTARFVRGRGYRFGMPEAVVRRMCDRIAAGDTWVLHEFAEEVDPAASQFLALADMSDGEGIDRLTAGLTYLAEVDLREILPLIRSEVLLLHGLGDRIIPITAARELAQGLSKSRLVELEGTHMPWLAHPEHTTKLCCEFLYPERFVSPLEHP